MTETKFTPGPWQLVQAEYSDSGRYVEPRVFSYADPDDPKIICSMAVRDGTTEEANGLMVAAAPDLYEALYDVLSWAGKDQRKLTRRGWTREKEIASLNRAATAIAKAVRP